MLGLIVYLFVLFLLFCILGYTLFIYLTERKSFVKTVKMCNSDSAFDRPYYALKDEVGNEMLFSPFFATNTACAIRQVQDLVDNPQLFPKSLKPKDVSLYYCFTINGKSLVITDGYEPDTTKALKICSCDSDSLKRAYEIHKEVK